LYNIGENRNKNKYKNTKVFKIKIQKENKNMFNKFDELKDIIAKIELELNKAKSIFDELGVDTTSSVNDFSSKAQSVGSEKIEGGNKVVEGVFDGQQMIGPDGKRYSIPANYCSKSKLVEGDILKLIVKPDGGFIYKQIGPIERKRLKGILSKDPLTGEFKAHAGDKEYKLLKASVTYFHGDADDEAVILVPEDGESVWAAVENIISKLNANNNPEDEGESDTYDNDLNEFDI
jgi:predicted lactoylglutathione lyase